MRGHCAIRKIQRKRAIRHKHRTAFFVLQSARGRSMRARSTQSRERVKGRSPLRSPEAAPLAGVRGSAPWSPSINTRKKYESALNSIAKWVSRGSKTLRGCRAAPCRSPEAAPLVGLGAKPLGSPFTPKSSQSPLFPRLSAAHASALFPRFGESARGGLRR